MFITPHIHYLHMLKYLGDTQGIAHDFSQTKLTLCQELEMATIKNPTEKGRKNCLGGRGSLWVDFAPMNYTFIN